MYYSVKFSGTQGEGVDTIGEIFSTFLHNRGHYLYSYRNFSSRIKGGYSSHEVSFAARPVRVKKENNDILVALSSEAYERDIDHLSPEGLAIVDSEVDTQGDSRVISLPLAATAKEGPGDIYKWTVALGALSAMAGVEPAHMEAVLQEVFARKGQKVIENNIKALSKGFDLAKGKASNPLLINLAPLPGEDERVLVQGSEAVAQAALMAGCDFISGYPISPASEVFSHLAREFTPEDRRTALQTEDEISALTMAIGASYAGATAMVSTSGPGLSLMIEGIGLASMTRTPLVIVNAQRSGPSTGMPTKHEQSDLDLALAGSHGDVLPLVLCPSSVEEIYTDLPRAFFLAEKYRSPVIFLTDFALMSARTSINPPSAAALDIDSLKSERAVPGTEGKMFHVTGNQAAPNGLPTDRPHHREKEMAKRVELLTREIEDDAYTEIKGGDKLLLIGIGSTRGAIVSAMESELKEVASAVFPRVLAPFPNKSLSPILERFDKIIIFDANASGQLLRRFRTNSDLHQRFISARKFTGEPFNRGDILEKAREVLSNV